MLHKVASKIAVVLTQHLCLKTCNAAVKVIQEVLARKAHWGRPLGGKRVHEHLLVIVARCYWTWSYYPLTGRERNCTEGVAVRFSGGQEYCI